MNKVDKAGRSDNEDVTRDLFVDVPRGWSRGLEKDNVVYISPTSDCLRSKEEVVNYLVSHQTCKCGLECPLYLDKTFDFDADIPSRHFRISDWDKDGHTSICKQTLGAMNAYKYCTPAWAKTGGTKDDTTQPFHDSSMARPKQEESVVKSDNDVDISKVHLPSFETFTRLPEQKHNETLQGQAKSKKPSQAKRAGCYKRKPTTASQVLSTVSSSPEASKNMQGCKTVTSTSTPIPHSYVKSEQNKDVISLTQHTPIVSKVSARQEEQRFPGMNITSVPLVSFPSSRFNASSYLASLSTGGSANVPNRTSSTDLPYLHSHAGGILHPSVQTVSTPHPLANTSGMDGSSFTHKPVTTVFAAGVTRTTYLSSSTDTMTNQKPVMTLQESSSLSNNAALPPNNNSVAKLTLGKSKAGFSMKNAGNVRNIPSANNRYSPQCKAPTATASLSVTCAAPSSALSHAKTHVTQQDIPLASKSLASVHGPQTSRVNTMDLSEKGEPVTPRAVYPAAAMMTHNDKNKQRPSTAASSKASESVNQPFQYCGILLPTTGMVPQVQVAGGSGIQLQQSSPLVDPSSHFTNLYALQGIPYANNVGALGNSGVFGMTPGTVVPYVLGIAQTATTTKATAVATTISKVSPTSPSVMPSISTPSTGSAAIAAAYSAFVSIAPASGTSSSYSQQLMNLVNSYSNPYWQQFLSHAPNANALAYQLMQMNQYSALRGSTGQAATTVKTSTTKSVTSQAKQATTTTAATSASSSTAPQGIAATPVALVVLGSKDLPSASSSSNKTTGNVEMAAAKTSSQTTVTAECAVQKTSKQEGTSATDTSSASNLSTSECKVTETTTTVMSTFSRDNTTLKTCDVATKQEHVDDSTKNVGIHCDSQQNEEKKTDKEEDAKSIPQISHEDLTNKETLSDGLGSSENKNSEDVNVDKSFALSSGNVEDRTCENTVILSEEESKECTNDDSSVNVTDINHEQAMSLDSAIEVKPLPPDESEPLDTTHTIQEEIKEDIEMEKNPKSDLEEEKHVQLGKRNRPERKDEDKTDFNTIVKNGQEQSSSNDVKSESEEKKEEEYHPAEFTIGDVVWAQARGLPSWPGKIVDERDVGGVRADNGKKWVMWFGDHNYSQVEVEKLKTLSEGLKTLDDKGKKRKYRGKKTRIGLEQAIGEALEELDQKERLRSRQGPKAKKRRL